MTNGSEWVVSEVGAGGDVEGVELGAVGGEAVYCLVRQLVTRGQVEGLNVAAVGGEAAKGGVAHILVMSIISYKANSNPVLFAPGNPWGWDSWGSPHISWPGSPPQFPQCQLGTQTSQPSASLSHPGPIHSKVCSPDVNINVHHGSQSFLSYLSWSAERYDVKVGEHPEQQLPGKPPVDEGLVVLGEHTGDLPLGDPHVDRVAIPIPEFDWLLFKIASLLLLTWRWYFHCSGVFYHCHWFLSQLSIWPLL